MSTGPKLAEVVTLYEKNASDIVSMLHKLADDIEAGKYGRANSVVAVLHSDELTIEVFGFGDADPARTIGILHLGAAGLARGAGGGE